MKQNTGDDHAHHLRGSLADVTRDTSAHTSCLMDKDATSDNAHHRGGLRAIIAAAIANLGIAVSKFVAWLLTGSSSMLAESIHSVADTTNQALLLVGSKRAQRAPDQVHQFGYGRSRYIAAFVVAILLFSVGGLFALFEAYEKFQHPQEITAWKWVPVTVLVISIVLEGYSLSQALKEAHEARGSMKLFTYIRTSRAPEIPVVLLEDIAALCGLVLALGGVSATLLTGDGRWDGVGSAAIGVLLVIVALFLAAEIASLLVGESATQEVQQSISDALCGDGDLDVMYVRTLHLGPEELLIAAKFSVDPSMDGTAISTMINQAEQRVRNSVPLTCRIYLEPELGK
ncbi:MAG: cation diffusion facilitator family transporter [Actinomycetaceae bacterium]|nr:cation diffusion facilitator family transporter [Actinomycetaceae bacterium]